MEDRRKTYKGIKFLNVGQQFLGAQLRKTSSKALSINGSLPYVNKNSNSVRSSDNNSIAKSVVKSSGQSISKSLIKNTFNDNRSINICKKTKPKSKKKNSRFPELEILKQLIEIKKEEENIIKENPNINVKARCSKLINNNLSSKNLNQLKNKIISFKSIIINNINNTENKTSKDNNNTNKDNKKEKNNKKNKCSNNVIVYKTENSEKNEYKKKRKIFCCL